MSKETTKNLQDCVDGVSLGLKAAEDDLLTIMKSHMKGCDEKHRKAMRKANRKLLRIHCDLADLRDECFPDVTVQSGGT